MIGAVLAIGSQLESFWGSVSGLLTHKTTQHVEDPDATQIAAQWAQNMNDQLVALYGQDLVNAAARDFANRMKALVDSGARWGDYTAVRVLMSNYFARWASTDPVNPLVMVSALHGEAYWVLRCMNRESNTEFQLSVASDYRNALFPALQAQGADTSKIVLSSSGSSDVSAQGIVDKAAIFVTRNKTVLLILVAAAVVWVLINIVTKK